MGYGHPSYIGNHYYGYIKPYWWVYDHPLLWEKNHVLTTAHMFANMKVNGKDYIPYIMEKKTVPNHQPNINVDWDCHPISRLGHHQTKMKPPTISSISFVIYSWGPCSGWFVPRENPIIINTSWVSSFHVQYPLVICYSLRTGSHGPVEILDFPIKNGGSVHSYVSLPEVKYPIKSH